MSKANRDRKQSPDVTATDIEAIRRRLADKGLVYFAIVVPLAATLSLLRTLEHGWNNLYFLHISIAVLIITCAIFRKRLSYGVSVSILLGIILILGIGGLFAFGLVAGGVPLLIIFAVMTAIAFGSRAGLIACAVDLGIIAAIGVAVCTGKITFAFDISNYATSITAWSMMAVVFFMLVPIAVVAFGVLNEHLETSLRNLRESYAKREQLVKTLKFKNKELQDIVYTASHDLRSPLVNIQGFSGELEKDCDHLLKLLDKAAVDPELKAQIEPLAKESIPQSLKFIFGSSNKMAGLLDGLLRVSRVGTAEINRKPIDVNKTMSEVLAAMEYQMKENDIAVTIETLPNCVGDANMVDQVFSNLVGNAMKYRNSANENLIKISGRVEGDMSIYCVEDNGIGIAPKHQKKVFEIFHRLNPNDSAGGEGLGLTIVTRIIDRLGGNIWVESEPDEGSKFFFALPTA
jgi:signal transduction histidine kinase